MTYDDEDQTPHKTNTVNKVKLTEDKNDMQSLAISELRASRIGRKNKRILFGGTTKFSLKPGAVDRFYLTAEYRSSFFL